MGAISYQNFLNPVNLLIIFLIFSSVVSFALFIERYIYLQYLTRSHQLFYNDLKLYMDSVKSEHVLKLEFQNFYLFFKPIWFILKTKNTIYEKKLLLNDSISLNRNLLEFRIDIIAFIANISPIIGILGTVLGIMTGIKGLEDPSSNLLSYGFWQALITTALGLTISIISSFFSFYLHSKLKKILDIIIKDVEEILKADENKNSALMKN